MPRRAALRFLGLTVLGLAVLTAGWSLWGELYTEGYCAVANHFHRDLDGGRFASFAPDRDFQEGADVKLTFGTRIAATPEMARAAGVRPGETAYITKPWHQPANAQLLAYAPMAAFVALILATRMSWRRRGLSLLGGGLALGFFIVFRTRLFVRGCFRASREEGRPLADFGNFENALVDALQPIFCQSLAFPYAVALILWAVCATWRRELALRVH